MAAVRLLSEQLINRIAAGEVVERPASALKELLENSLDAGADKIAVQARSGGRRLIRVEDNGRGMTPDDLLLAIERHATSKLAEETDLLHIDTLGFRGEALASLGAVSRMTITSAAERDGLARRVRISGGRVMGVEDASRDQGTSVEIQDLFFNVPARRKFLKTNQTEAAHLLDVVQRYALGRLDLRLVYRHNEQEVLSVSPREDEKTRLAAVLGRETARSLFRFEGQSGGLNIEGWLGPPENARARASSLYLFVNGRPVSDRLLIRSVLEAYQGRLTGGRYPAGLIRLSLDPALVDVNVHPAKAEVRFHDPGQVFKAASEIMSRALSEHFRPFQNRRPQASPPPRPYRFSPGARHGLGVAETPLWTEPASSDHPAFPEPFSPPVEPPDPGPPGSELETEPQAEPETRELRPVGQLHRSYILAQGPDGLFIVDQHAAHERVLYEKMKKDLAQGALPAQQLLLPETLETTPIQAAALDGIIDRLARFGFDLEPFGGRTYVLRAVPAALAGRNPLEAVAGIIDQIQNERPDQGLADFERKLLSSLACHGALKAGQDLTLAEMDRLLSDLAQTEVPTNCPHGRPLVFHLSRREIEKKFKRA